MSFQVIADGLTFPEGPTFDKEGNLYTVEILAGRIRRISSDGTKSVFVELGGGPNGMALGPDGNFYVCNNGGFVPPREPARIERVTPDGEVTRLITNVDGVELHYPNDITFDQNGNFYFTDPIFPEGGLENLAPPSGICFGAPGEEVHRIHLNLHIPNGIAISPDASTLVVCETQTNIVRGYEILEPGVLGEARVYGNLGEGAFPDGMCFDRDGYLIVGGYQSGKLHVFPPGGGEKESTLEVEDPGVTNLCFGGPTFSTLYVTESHAGRVVSLPWERPGMVLFPDS